MATSQSDHIGNYYDVIDMIRAFSGRDNTIGIPRPLIKFMDSLEGGAFLSQLIYWSDKGGRSDGWFYKTYQEWYEDIYLSEYEIRKWSKRMVEEGYLETKVMRANGSPTVHYRLNMRKFSESFLKFLRNYETEKSQEPKPKNADSITETTSETTQRVQTETTSHVEKSNVDFSRGSAETQPQQSSFDSLSGTTKNGSTSVESKRPPAKKEPVPKKEPTPRKPDALFDAIAEVWNSAPGMTGKIKQQLTGKIPEKHVDHMANFDVPATPDEVRAFAEWYAKACVGCTMPVSRDKIQNQFYAFRRAHAAKIRKAIPKFRYINGRKQEYNAESMKWYDVGPDDRDYQPQEAYGS